MQTTFPQATVKRTDGTVERDWHLLTDLSMMDPYKAPEQYMVKVAKPLDPRDQITDDVQCMVKTVRFNEFLEWQGL